jgi:hypothetical protein
MLPFLGFAVCIVGAAGFGVWAFWPTHRGEEPSTTRGHVNDEPIQASNDKKELIKSVVQYTKMNRIDEIMDQLSLNIRVQMERQKHLKTDPATPFNYFQFGNPVIFRAREGNWGGQVITLGASLNALGAHEYPTEVSFLVRTPKMAQDGAQLKSFSDNLLLPPPIKWDLDEYIKTWGRSEEAIADLLNDYAQKGHSFNPNDIDFMQQELSRRLESLDIPAEKLANDARQYM